MKMRISNLFLGLVLILAGGLFLAQNLGWLPVFGPLTWVFALSGLSLMFFGVFLTRGMQQWGWLFPAFISAGTAITIWLAETGVDAAWVAAPVLLGVALPFLCVYIVDRSNWWALIPAWVMLVIAGVVGLAERAPGELVATLILWGIGLPFLVVFLSDRSHWWALIPGGILAAIGAALWIGGPAMDVLEIAGSWWPVLLIIAGLYVIFKKR